MTNKPNDVRVVPVELLDRIVNLNNSFADHRQAQHDLVKFLAQPADQQGEPSAWANGEQLLLCSLSRLDVGHSNPIYRGLPRNIAGSALKTEYCDTPLYRHARPATTKVDERAEFETWFTANCTDEGLTLERCAARPEQYELDETDQLYRGWQARAKLNGASKVVLPERKLICGYEDVGFNECLDEFSKLNGIES
ncbi:hypothetical protein ACTAB0_11695 [Pseudomonas syringae]|uniref:hypothetical protein n=1 Tax=Pseudomonas syringae TaxID=317 RepID=UPI003F796D59